MAKQAKSSGTVADKIRELTSEVLSQARKHTGKASMSWRELQGFLQEEIDTWGKSKFKINPGVLLGVFLVKDSPVEVTVKLSKSAADNGQGRRKRAPRAKKSS